MIGLRMGPSVAISISAISLEMTDSSIMGLCGTECETVLKGEAGIGLPPKKGVMANEYILEA